MNITTVLIALFLIVIFVLVFCILYLVSSYRKLLDKYTENNIDGIKSEGRKKINLDTNRYFDSRIDAAIDKALSQTVDIITRTGESVAKDVRKKTIDKLSEDQKAQSLAVEGEFDEAKLEIEKYKAEKYEEIRKNANEILTKVAKQTLGETIDSDKQEKLIIKALENAKNANLF